jgi:DNA-binding NarL/FixJ family response regulator
MAAVAIYSADPSRRHRLERLLRAEPTITLVGLADDRHSVARLLQRIPLDAMLVDAPPPDQLNQWVIQHRRTAFIAMVNDADTDAGLAALQAGACAILPRSAKRAEIVASLEAASNGLAALPRPMLEMLLDDRSHSSEPLRGGVAAGELLTARELDVLAAMADGASNKTIARRLGISFHTAKFHVAAIMAKLDADSRTEAVARAAHLGLVML